LSEIIKISYKQNVDEKRFKKYYEIIDIKIYQIVKVIESIENYLCYLYNDSQDNQMFFEATSKLVQSTFAYYLDNDVKKHALITIFNLIAEKIVNEIKPEKAPYFAKSLYGIETSKKILLWTEQYINILKEYSIDALIDEIIKLFLDIYNAKLDVSQEILMQITKMWINGMTYIEIYNELQYLNIKIIQIEKICGNTISYHLSFLIGNIIDAIASNTSYSEELNRKLMLLQKQIKYGVPKQFQVLFCDNIFDDKVVAKQVDIALGGVLIDENFFKDYIVSKQSEILKLLIDYPEYYTYKFNLYISKW
jgi:hypothetical protein